MARSFVHVALEWFYHYFVFGFSGCSPRWQRLFILISVLLSSVVTLALGKRKCGTQVRLLVAPSSLHPELIKCHHRTSSFIRIFLKVWHNFRLIANTQVFCLTLTYGISR